MENNRQAQISNSAAFLVLMLENARKTHIGILSVLSISIRLLVNASPVAGLLVMSLPDLTVLAKPGLTLPGIDKLYYSSVVHAAPYTSSALNSLHAPVSPV